jgi:hypothetical protein
MASELNVGGITLDTAGAIGTVDADLRLYTTTASHVGLRFGLGYVAPTDNTGAITTGAAELGHSSYKFSNGHFSGTVNAAGIAFQSATTGSGTGTGYTLDSYEVGTFTPTFTFGSGNASMTFNAQVGNYTKVGNVVTFSAYIYLSAKGSSTGTAAVAGLPFNALTQTSSFTPVVVKLGAISFADTPTGHIGSNGVVVSLQETTNAGVVSALTDGNFANTSEIMVSGSYLTA